MLSVTASVIRWATSFMSGAAYGHLLVSVKRGNGTLDPGVGVKKTVVDSSWACTRQTFSAAAQRADGASRRECRWRWSASAGATRRSGGSRLQGSLETGDLQAEEIRVGGEAGAEREGPTRRTRGTSRPEDSVQGTQQCKGTRAGDGIIGTRLAGGTRAQGRPTRQTGFSYKALIYKDLRRNGISKTRSARGRRRGTPRRRPQDQNTSNQPASAGMDRRDCGRARSGSEHPGAGGGCSRDHGRHRHPDTRESPRVRGDGAGLGDHSPAVRPCRRRGAAQVGLQLLEEPRPFGPAQADVSF